MKKAKFLIACLFPLFVSCNPNDGSYLYRDQSTRNNTDQNSDREITTRVKATLMDDSSLSSSGRYINVETNNGVVTLSGEVPSKAESYSIERKVKSISGVRRVNNQLTVSS